MPLTLLFLAEVGWSSFYQAYRDTSDPEDMKRYLEQHFNVGQVLKEMEEPGCRYWLLLGEQPIGYAKMRQMKVITELEPESYAELQRMYVLADWWGKGMGDLLMQHCLDYARQIGVQWVWLGVWQENWRAVRFYRSWGFEVIGQRVFDFAGVPHVDYVMAVRVPADGGAKG